MFSWLKDKFLRLIKNVVSWISDPLKIVCVWMIRHGSKNIFGESEQRYKLLLAIHVKCSIMNCTIILVFELLCQIYCNLFCFDMLGERNSRDVCVD